MNQRRRRSLADFPLDVQKRLHSAWFDIEVTTLDLQQRFRFCAQTVNDLKKELGPRPDNSFTPRGLNRARVLRLGMTKKVIA